jgi:hypothetical protein
MKRRLTKSKILMTNNETKYFSFEEKKNNVAMKEKIKNNLIMPAQLKESFAEFIYFLQGMDLIQVIAEMVN